MKLRNFKLSIAIMLVVALMSAMFLPTTGNAIFYEEPQFDDLLEPFWNTTTVYNESVFMYKEGSAMPEAQLMYDPIKILSVKDNELNTTYKEGVDYKLENGKLKLLPGTSIKYYTRSDVFQSTSVEGKNSPCPNGEYILSDEKQIPTMQIAVTYTCAKNSWKGPVPQFASSKLPRTIDKLKKGERLMVTIYGDSISAGCGASQMIGIQPYMQPWDYLLGYNLSRYYEGPVNIKNNASGGWTSDMAIQNFDTKYSSGYDLVILGFGMNDSDSPDAWITKIETLMSKFRALNPNVEFILISTMLANEEVYPSFRNDNFRGYYNKLKAKEGNGVAVANMTGVHAELLKRKSYKDMTSNNINHPNDFLARWYAQYISGMLISSTAKPLGGQSTPTPPASTPKPPVKTSAPVSATTPKPNNVTTAPVAATTAITQTTEPVTQTTTPAVIAPNTDNKTPGVVLTKVVIKKTKAPGSDEGSGFEFGDILIPVIIGAAVLVAAAVVFIIVLAKKRMK